MIGPHPGRRVLPIALAMLGGVAAGCSTGDGLPREPISGTVTLDGQPLAEGAIQFSPAGGATAGPAVSAGALIEGGRFSIDREHGLIPGSYRVGVNAAAPTSAQAGPAGPGGKPVARAAELIPAKYNAETTLTAQVQKGGRNRFQFDLRSK
jgi:hypothetical protein